MQRPTRKQALEWIRFHASNGDMASATKVYIESRISLAAFNEAVKQSAKLNL